MAEHDHSMHQSEPRPSFWHSCAGITLIVFLAVAALLLGYEHRLHLFASGLYSRLRHPQYAGFVLVLTGFLVQWPTLLTLAMYPFLIWMYARLARSEERETRARFGTVFDSYARAVPAFFPALKSAPQPAN